MKKSNNLCPGYKASLKKALDDSRIVLAELDGCKPEEVKPFHPSEYELDIKQEELF